MVADSKDGVISFMVDLRVSIVFFTFALICGRMPSVAHACVVSVSFASSTPPAGHEVDDVLLLPQTEGIPPFVSLFAILVTTTFASLFSKILFSYLSVLSVPT